jgi:hypothetical protein
MTEVDSLPIRRTSFELSPVDGLAPLRQDRRVLVVVAVEVDDVASKLVVLSLWISLKDFPGSKHFKSLLVVC